MEVLDYSNICRITLISELIHGIQIRGEHRINDEGGAQYIACMTQHEQDKLELKRKSRKIEK